MQNHNIFTSVILILILIGVAFLIYLELAPMPTTTVDPLGDESSETSEVDRTEESPTIPHVTTQETETTTTTVPVPNPPTPSLATTVFNHAPNYVDIFGAGAHLRHPNNWSFTSEIFEGDDYIEETRFFHSADFPDQSDRIVLNISECTATGMLTSHKGCVGHIRLRTSSSRPEVLQVLQTMVSESTLF